MNLRKGKVKGKAKNTGRLETTVNEYINLICKRTF